MFNPKLKDKKATVVAIDPSGPVRQLLTDVIRNNGFEQVQGIANIKDTLSLLEVEPIDWIITPLLPDQDINAFHLLKLVSQNPSLQSVRITLLLEEEEFKYLPEAFELGLMNWIEKPFNKDSITEAFKIICEELESIQWDTTYFSGKLFSEYLNETECYQELLSLSENLLKSYPGNPEFLLNMARPLKLLDRDNECKSVLKQVKILDESKEDIIAALSNELFEGNDVLTDDESVNNILGLKMAVIVDPDEEVRNNIISFLNDLGCPEIREFSDGEEAWHWISQNLEEEIDFILQEWRIPSLTGPYFIQRVRDKLPLIPIIVVSDLIDEEDLPLLNEMGVANHIQKPLEQKTFLKNIIEIIRQERIPTETPTLERKIRQSLSANDKENAKKYFNTYIEDLSIPEERKSKIKAEFAFYNKKFSEAKDLAVEALRNTPDSLMILSLLGKILMALRDFPAALRCLTKAQSISPKNIARLCTIAEVKAEHNINFDEIENAKVQDPESDVVSTGECKVALALGNTDKAKEIMEKMGSINDLISYMNNKAVSYAKCGYYEEGISEYTKTMAAVPESNKGIQAIVMYNMSLAYIRQEEQGLAIEKLDEVIELGESRVLKKSISLKSRLEKAVAGGTVVTLNTSEDEQKKTKPMQEMGAPDGADDSEDGYESEHKDLIAEIEIDPGKLCLFRLYIFNRSRNINIKKWLNNLPRFRPRATIEKQESIVSKNRQKVG